MAAITQGQGTPLYEDVLKTLWNQRLWWALCATLATVVVLAGTIIVLVLRPRPAPYAFVVDKATGARLGMLEPIPGTAMVNDQNVRADIEDFIRNAFSVSSDWDEENARLRKAYAVLPSDYQHPQPRQMLTNWYHGGESKDANNPQRKSEKGWQDVTDITVLKVGTVGEFSQYEAHFNVVWYPKAGMTATTPMRLALTAALTQPTADNPLGFAVTQLDFDKENE